MAPIAPIPPTPPLAQGAAPAPVAAGLLQAGAMGMVGGASAAGQAPLASFQEFFADAVKTASRLDEQSEDQQRKLLVGDIDNLHDVTIAMEKADLALQLTMAVRDKVVSAYQAVMQMTV